MCCRKRARGAGKPAFELRSGLAETATNESVDRFLERRRLASFADLAGAYLEGPLDLGYVPHQRSPPPMGGLAGLDERPATREVALDLARGEAAFSLGFLG